MRLSSSNHSKQHIAGLTVGAVGIVFGDIGISLEQYAV